MSRIIFPILILHCFSPLFCQYDPQAKKILDRFSENAKNDFPVLATFDYHFRSAMDKSSSQTTGELIMDSNRYRLLFGNVKRYCNGDLLWNFNTEVNEVYISEPPDSATGEDIFFSNPGRIFDLYKSGYKYRLAGEKVSDQGNFFEVELYPEDLSKTYHTIEIIIHQETYHPHAVSLFQKNGDRYSVVFTRYSTRVSVSPGNFVFKPEKHPGAEIIDLRL